MCCYVLLCAYVPNCRMSRLSYSCQNTLKIPEVYNLPSLGLKNQCRVSIKPKRAYSLTAPVSSMAQSPSMIVRPLNRRNIRAACGHPVILPPFSPASPVSLPTCQPSVRPPSLPAKFDSSNKYKLFEYYVSFLSVKLRTLCAGPRMRRQSLHISTYIHIGLWPPHRFLAPRIAFHNLFSFRYASSSSISFAPSQFLNIFLKQPVIMGFKSNPSSADLVSVFIP